MISQVVIANVSLVGYIFSLSYKALNSQTPICLFKCFAIFFMSPYLNLPDQATLDSLESSPCAFQCQAFKCLPTSTVHRLSVHIFWGTFSDLSDQSWRYKRGTTCKCTEFLSQQDPLLWV